MGQGRPPGANVGAAHGSITINTTQAQQAPAVMRGVAQGINQAMGTVNNSLNQAQGSLNNFAGSFRGVVGAFGAREVARFAADINQVATAFDRQTVAARNLAGSQARVNELLDAYHRSTGNAIDDATALSDVTRLIAVGFADNVAEIDEFTRAVRGISLATGRPQEFVVTQLQLELLNQTGFRLDQIGLGMAEVRRRADDLRAANQRLTAEQAYQQAVLQVANEKYADLTRSAEAQASGIEKLTKAWKDFRLEVGQLSQGPINFLGEAMANWLNQAAKDLQVVNDALVFFGQMIGLVDRRLNRFDRSAEVGAYERDRFLQPGRTASAPDPAKPREADAIRMEWGNGLEELQRQTNRELEEENRNYQRNRANSERDYQETLAREAEDFYINRRRAEQAHLRSINDLHEEANRREQRMAQDLARTIADAQGDSADRIADIREDVNQRLVELEEEYQRDREKRAEAHRDNLLEAAGRLDAAAVAEAQRNFARQEQAAQEAYDEQRAELQEQLQQRINDEREALAQRIADAQEAYQRQLEDAREADARRLADMEADFALRKAREDEDRSLRLGRLTEDHNQQLAEMDRAHGERLTQIRLHAFEERTLLDEEANENLKALGVRNQAYDDLMERRMGRWEELWDKFMNHVESSMTIPRSMPGGPVQAYANGGIVGRTGLAMLHGGEVVLSRAMLRGAVPPPLPAQAMMDMVSSNNTNTSHNTFHIYQQPGESGEDLADRLAAILERVNGEA